MEFKPWQRRVLKDRLVEIGQSSGDVHVSQYSYLEFADGGRIRNVTVSADLDSKLKELLGVEEGAFYLLEGQHTHTKDEATFLIGLGKEGGSIYAMDMEKRGYGVARAKAVRERKFGKICQWVGLPMMAVGVPLVVAIVGIFFVGAG
ncbi:hypothetical protein ACFX58_13880 [Sphingomonas sp. NCPPB 2930]